MTREELIEKARILTDMVDPFLPGGREIVAQSIVNLVLEECAKLAEAIEQRESLSVEKHALHHPERLPPIVMPAIRYAAAQGARIAAMEARRNILALLPTEGRK